jgi:predicted Zn-dependent protease
MKKTLFAVAFATTASVLAGCYTNPVTGRRGLSLVPESEMRSMAAQQYTAFLSTNRPVQGTRDVEMVKRIGSRMASAVNQYLTQRGLQDQVAGYQWEFNLVNNNQANAWCMPGGKVVVYSGLLPITQNEAALAVVMGHEIAHAISRHGNERMSQQLAAQAGGVALSVAMSSKPAQAQNMWNAVYGVGSQVGLLRYGRNQESEADRIGLIFTAMSGYDPRQAIPFWQRMAAKGGQKPPEFLSTHPSDDRRLRDLQAWMPEALKYYRPQ